MKVSRTLKFLIYQSLWILRCALRASLRYLLGRRRRNLAFSNIRFLNLPGVLMEKLGLRFTLRLPWGRFLTPMYQVRAGDLHEPEVYGWIDLEEGDTALDVGAHHGWYTVLFSRTVGRTGRVMAVEPCPGNRRVLFDNVRVNKLSNVEVLPFALSDERGHLKLHLGEFSGDHTIVPPGSSGHSFLTGRSVLVPCKRLDDVLSSLDRVDLLKMDVEGAELKILAASKQLSKVRRLIVEVHNPKYFEPLKEKLVGEGFFIIRIAPNRIVATGPSEERRLMVARPVERGSRRRASPSYES